MRIRRLVKAQSLRSAAGELLLIILGILIALAISDWNDRRIARQHELAMLSEVRVALNTDLGSVESRLQFWANTATRIEHLLQVLDSKPPYERGLDRLFGAAYGTRPIKLNTAAYEALAATGLQTISNPTLRQRIASVFDEDYESLAMINTIDTGVIEIARDFYLMHFRDLQFFGSATPIDYEALLANDYYRNIVEYRLLVIESNQLATYEQVRAHMRDTLESLEDELAALQ